MLTPGDEATVTAIIAAAPWRGPNPSNETVDALYDAFAGRVPAALHAAGTLADRLWHERLTRPLTDAETDEVMRLRSVGFGAWTPADLDSFTDLLDRCAAVADWLLPAPVTSL